jgi:hypothetical protein
MLGLPRTTLLLCLLLVGTLVALVTLWGVRQLAPGDTPTTHEIKNLVATFQAFLEVEGASPGFPASPGLPAPGGAIAGLGAALVLGGWAAGRGLGRRFQQRSRSTLS